MQEVCPNLQAMALDPVHLAIVFEYASWRKRTGPYQVSDRASHESVSRAHGGRAFVWQSLPDQSGIDLLSCRGIRRRQAWPLPSPLSMHRTSASKFLRLMLAKFNKYEKGRTAVAS